jgi:hypothetical protein
MVSQSCLLKKLRERSIPLSGSVQTSKVSAKEGRKLNQKRWRQKPVSLTYSFPVSITGDERSGAGPGTSGSTIIV